MVVRMNPLTLFRPHPNRQYCSHNVDLNELCDECGPPDSDDDTDEGHDERILRLVETEVHNTVGEPHARPLVWTVGKPDQPGWRCARLPGTKEHTVVCIVRDKDGDLHYGVSAVAWSRVADSDLEWASAPVTVPR